jgi:putative MATE family efflux protein
VSEIIDDDPFERRARAARSAIRERRAGPAAGTGAASVAASVAGTVAGTIDRHTSATSWGLLAGLVRIALPTTLVMVLSAMSLVVDTYFVTGLGSVALAGASLVLPIYLLLVMAFGGGIGVGLSVVISLRLGRGDGAAAQRAVGSAFAMALGVAFGVTLAFALGGRELFARMAGTGPVLDAAMSFARPIFYGAPVIALALTMSNILRSEKRLVEAAAMLLVSSAVNAALNPILIHGHLGAPAMGIAGAGLATVLGFVVSALLGALFMRRRSGRLRLGLAVLRIDRDDMREIARIAFPTLATYVVTKVIVMALSVVWARFGTEALAAYGLANRLEHLLALVVYGMGSAVLTLGGEARGAGRLREFVRICWIAATCVVALSTLLTLAVVAAPGLWFELFGAAPDVVASGATYLRITALAYPLYALGLTLNYGYQTLALAHLPLIWGILRGFVIAVPVAVLVVAAGGSIAAASVGVALSMAVLGVIAAAWLPRSIRARSAAP